MDATTYYIAKTASKVVFNQPRFRTLTGAITGETAYIYGADKAGEDVTLEGAITSAIIGGIGGQYLGRATRSLVESDAKKWVRYIKSGRFEPSKDEAKAIQRIGEFAFKPKPQTPMKDITQGAIGLGATVGREAIRYEEPQNGQSADPRSRL